MISSIQQCYHVAAIQYPGTVMIKIFDISLILRYFCCNDAAADATTSARPRLF